MIRVQYSDDLKSVKRRFLNGNRVNSLKQRWNNCVAKYPILKKIFKGTIEELMVGHFYMLAEIYERYQKLRVTLPEKQFEAIDTELKDAFDWKNKRDSINEFFMRERNGFSIHTCHYCDTAYINVYKDATGSKNHFDIDHVLDKGKCPMLTVSLMNFVPACSTCNSSIKQSSLIGDNRTEWIKLSPTNPRYDFSGNIEIELRPMKAPKLRALDSPHDYEINFSVKGDPDYMKSVELFRLKHRYDYHKVEGLRLLDLKSRYTDKEIESIARILKVSPSEIREDIFGSDFSTKHHRTFGILKNDILNK